MYFGHTPSEQNEFIINSMNYNNISSGLNVFDAANSAQGLQGDDFLNSNIENWEFDLDTDPLFVNVSENNFRLSDFSPMLGAGAIVDSLPEFDMDSLPRIQPNGTFPDLGCYENALSERIGNTTYYVSTDNGSDDNPGSAEQSFETINKGLKSAWYGDTVVVYPGSYVEHVNFRGKNVILGSLFLQTNDSTFINTTVIDGSVNVISNEDTTAQLVGFSVTNNNDENVFGVNVIESGITLKHNKIYGHNWGGIYAHNSNLVIEDCNIFENIKTSDNGAGILVKNESSINIARSNIYNNFVNSGDRDGGGISIQGSSIGQISNSKIHGNATGNWGGGIRRNTSSLHISNSEIFGNSSTYSSEVMEEELR